MQKPPPRSTPGMRRDLLICLILAVTTAAVYASVGRNKFVNYDDEDYVTTNEHVQEGLTWEGVTWAFTSGGYAANWHPLTWISHMVDCQLFGPWAGGHHLVNLALHIFNTLLLYWVLRRMTDAVWRSAMVAGLFALHPLHVESVAWVAERKDVLCAAFGLLSILAYVRYVERPGLARYSVVFALYLLGLLAKPMLVTLPCVLLLLDYWPLGRFSLSPRAATALGGGNSRTSATSRDKRRPSATAGAAIGGLGQWRPLLVEKIPLFILAAASSAATMYAQSVGGAVISVEEIALPVRIGNALTAYVGYLSKTFAPIHLAVFYPHSYKLDFPAAFTAGIFLMVVSAVFLRTARRCPYLAVGWLWYLGTLVPVIGLVQVGAQSLADRYTYLPLIGIFIMVVWGVSDLAARWQPLRRALPTIAVATLLVCAVLTWRQVGYWSNSIALFSHTLEVTTPNPGACTTFGLAFQADGQPRKAEEQFRRAIELQPAFLEAHGNLGDLCNKEGRLDEAVQQYQIVLRLAPDDQRVHSQLGKALSRQGKTAEAEACFREALRRKYPSPAVAHSNLGLALQQGGKIDEAMQHYHEAVRLRPKLLDAWNNMAWIRATHPDSRFRNGAEAVKFANQAIAVSQRDATMLDTLAAAYAENGQFERARATVEEAMASARRTGQTAILAGLEKRAALFKEGRPYRDPTLTGPAP